MVDQRLRARIERWRGNIAEFVQQPLAIIFGLLVAFRSNDIWDRNKRAQRVVLTQADTLVALHSLSIASGVDSNALRGSIRAYASAVVEDEWPRLQSQERSARTDAALNALLPEVAQPGAAKDASVQRTMLEMVLRNRSAHEDRLDLSYDRTAVTKWAAVLLLALITTHAIAVVHFEPPVFVPPGPIVDALRRVPM